MTSLPLVLTLEPLLPQRTPRLGEERSFRYGFQLRLPDGPVIDRNDPLLAVLGAEVVTIVATREHGEALQDQSIDPGAELRAVGEPLDEDGDEVVGVWDTEQVRCAGLLPSESAAQVAAALEQGIDIDLLAISEERAVLDDRRVSLDVLVFCRATVEVAHDPSAHVMRPQRPVRRRVVLFADTDGDLRWWDASAASGPADITELPVSQELRRELQRLAQVLRQARQAGRAVAWWLRAGGGRLEAPGSRRAEHQAVAPGAIGAWTAVRGGIPRPGYGLPRLVAGRAPGR